MFQITQPLPISVGPKVFPYVIPDWLLLFALKARNLGLLILITSISTKFLVNQTYLIDIKDLFYIVVPNSTLNCNNVL